MPTHTFINYKDPLSDKINQACNDLFIKIPTLDIEALPFDEQYRNYFKKCHVSRPHFSLKTSANLLYHAIKSTGKKWADVTIMDYGAGLGTLYLIAKLIGVKKIIYNDLLPEFATPAIAVDKALGITMDEYIIGDTESTCKVLAEKNIICDVIVSRNVLEHIYDLKYFFSLIYQYQPKAILYNSTTANWRNPAAHLQHIYLHYKANPILQQKKFKAVKSIILDITDADAIALAKALKQYGGEEFNQAVMQYKNQGLWPRSKNDYTNTCDETGNWREHLLPYTTYKKMAPNYNLQFLPGFWDVDYKNSFKSIFGKIANSITNKLGESGVLSASFIYIIAKPKL
jgi:2-polyprenyl-3-methyl-5-hydroxy-6-metoxy-1,4-benzoquinol methylase